MAIFLIGKWRPLSAIVQRKSFSSIQTNFFIKGCDAGTVTTESFLKARMGWHPINFKCDYTLGSGEIVNNGDISWQIERVKGSGNFETIAKYSSTKPNQFAETPIGSAFKARSILPDIVAVGSDTFSAVFRLYEVRCEDEGNFRCLVAFSNSTGKYNVTSEASLLVTAPAEKPHSAPNPNPDNIEEGMKVQFSCTANVGKPPGNIKWWRFRHGQSVPDFMGESNTTPLMQTDVCVYNLTSSISALSMTRDDDQSVWRCSVNNNLLTAYPDYEKPHEDSKKIRVYYKVSTPSIEVTPYYSKYQVGSNITIYCSADGNPSPLIDNHINYYIWTFRSRGKSEDFILTSNNGLLALQNIKEKNSGRYTCTAHNSFNGKEFNSSSHVEINIHSGRVSTISVLMAGSGRNTLKTSWENKLVACQMKFCLNVLRISKPDVDICDLSGRTSA
ncbi:CD166 antigen-like [Saccostrea echinata]|uniref:CD166 antigen-like n=1 Tax=Saccostrea echinata TaxID=191078 RepID=UPI002A80850C|nr:CD166 antigen-like [Saccostrea echinata]